MHINAFHQTVPEMSADFPEIAKLWELSWKKNGWRPHLWSLASAKQHPKFDQLSKHVARFPTVNNPVYESLCWLRWLVPASASGYSLWSDTDVINRSMSPDQFYPALWSRSITYPAHYFYKDAFDDSGKKKSPVAGILGLSPAFAERHLIDAVLALDPDNLPGEYLIEGNRHYSDMLWIDQLNSLGLLQYIATDIGFADEHPFSSVIHCSHHACANLGKQKLSLIKEIAP